MVIFHHLVAFSDGNSARQFTVLAAYLSRTFCLLYHLHA